MQWNQIKTLFILCFLVLDVYLLIQFMDKQEQTNLGVLEHESTSIEQQLADEDISLPELPTDIDEDEYYISVSPREFSDDDLSELDNFKNQSITTIEDDTMIISSFKKPVSIPIDESDEDIKGALSDELLHSEEYIYWDYNEKLNVLMLFQEKRDRPVYYNENGIIMVFLNDDNEATFYTQTMLDETETNDDEHSLIEPIKAIETLYNSNELLTGDDITSIGMGFHTRIPLESGVQVFSPTWRVVVNGEKNYFVNAIEGLVFASKDIDFLEDSIEDIFKRTEKISDKDYRKDVMEILEERLEDSEGEEQEE